ncbi:hypothetical protein JYT84_00845 [bacterium AH-315-M10]|nr:hypothetical protein [bacterium AH-315-M10]
MTPQKIQPDQILLRIPLTRAPQAQLAAVQQALAGNPHLNGGVRPICRLGMTPVQSESLRCEGAVQAAWVDPGPDRPRALQVMLALRQAGFIVEDWQVSRPLAAEHSPRD